MALAIFGIKNNGLNLAATLVLLVLVVMWLALIVYTYLDARRRISDPFLVACATVASFFPFIGTAVYTIVRPPEFLDDAHERELEIKAAELRVRQLREQTCPNCEYPVEKNYLRCPNCQRRLKDPCPTCGKPVDPRWGLCPYCETTLSGDKRRRPRRPDDDAPRERRPDDDRPRERRPDDTPRERRPEPRAGAEEKRPRRKKPRASSPSSGAGNSKPSAGGSKKDAPRSSARKEVPTSEQEQPRSPSREPDPDPRQA
jgi:hypothetical protein